MRQYKGTVTISYRVVGMNNPRDIMVSGFKQFYMGQLKNCLFFKINFYERIMDLFSLRIRTNGTHANNVYTLMIYRATASRVPYPHP
jgi:hypothetical protein